MPFYSELCHRLCSFIHLGPRFYSHNIVVFVIRNIVQLSQNVFYVESAQVDALSILKGKFFPDFFFNGAVIVLIEFLDVISLSQVVL